jgi:CheY-like chemotaxis protein
MTSTELTQRSKERIHLLLVEDDDLDALNTERALSHQPQVASLTKVRDGEAALELLRARKLPSRRLVVLLDLKMPKMGGIEFLRKVRETPELHSLPVVVMTASQDESDRAQAYALNAAGYFIKSADADELGRYVSSMCAYWSSVAFPGS